MSTAPASPRKPRAKPFTPLQIAALQIATAMVGAIGYELLDKGDGVVAHNIARRAVQIAVEVVKQGGEA